MVAPQIGHSRPLGVLDAFAALSNSSATCFSNLETRRGRFQIGILSRILRMSDTETGIITEPHQLIVDHGGVTRWGAQFDSIRVEPLPQGGKRIRVTIESGDGNFDLTEEQISHLVALLVSPSSV
jgi:hypothetical protein